MKLEPNYYADREVKERIQDISITSTELPLQRLKKDIEEHRINISNPSFCSNIYTFIENGIRNR